MRFKNHDQMEDVDQVRLEVFWKILSDSFQHGNPADMVRVQIRHPSLYRGDFNIPFQTYGTGCMTAERIMEVWAMLKQSDEDLDLDAHLDIVITRVSQTRGG